MIKGYRETDDNETNFGIFSELNVVRAKRILDGKGVRYEFRQEVELDDHVLKEWGAYDASSVATHIVYGLWILSEDIDKLGTSLADEFQERWYMRS